MYQKSPPITKHTGITQKSPNLSKQLENIKSLNKKSTKSKKDIKKLEQPLKYWEIGLPNYQIQMYEKALLIVNYTDNYYRNPQICLGNWKTSKVSKKKKKKKSTKSNKDIKILQQSLEYWEMGFPIYQIQMYQKAPLIMKHTDITKKCPNLS